MVCVRVVCVVSWGSVRGEGGEERGGGGRRLVFWKDLISYLVFLVLFVLFA